MFIQVIFNCLAYMSKTSSFLKSCNYLYVFNEKELMYIK